MAVTFTVQADSEAEARAKLARLCVLMGAVPLGRPMLLPGREPNERWMARAIEHTVTVSPHDQRGARAG